MPISDGSAARAAARIRITRWPRAPDGGRLLGSSTSVSTPSNGTRFGCPATSGSATASASSLIPASPNCLSLINSFASMLDRNLLFFLPARRRALSQRSQPTHRPHLIHRQNPSGQQRRLNLYFRHFIPRIQLVEHKFKLAPPQPLPKQIARNVLCHQPSQRSNRA